MGESIHQLRKRALLGIAAKAKDRQATSTGGNNPQLKEILPEAVKQQTRDELGKQNIPSPLLVYGHPGIFFVGKYRGMRKKNARDEIKEPRAGIEPAIFS